MRLAADLGWGSFGSVRYDAGYPELGNLGSGGLAIAGVAAVARKLFCLGSSDGPSWKNICQGSVRILRLEFPGNAHLPAVCNCGLGAYCTRRRLQSNEPGAVAEAGLCSHLIWIHAGLVFHRV